ncbi:MAG: cyclic nucleotide-binding domain-containing protein [Magnetococcales bacterium]|nr:cyclic nucleotide-binding domain-containing protein [Magnetococcales bacterium]
MDRALGKVYEAGRIIYKQEDRANCLYVIQSGKIEIFLSADDDEDRLAILEEGQIFGSVSLFTADKTHFSTARALTKCRLLKVDEKAFVVRLHQDPSLAFRIIRHMAQRIKDLDKKRLADLTGEVTGGGRSIKDKKIRKRLPNVHNFSVAHHILMVEDDPDFHQLVKAWLHKKAASELGSLFPSGINLEIVSSLGNAVSRLQKEKFDVILLDLNLPDSSGYETFIRLYNKFPDMPIVVVSGLDDEMQAIQAVKDGAQDFLVKGRFKKDDLSRAIQFALARHKATFETFIPSEEKGRDAPPHGSESLTALWRMFGDWRRDDDHRS